MLAVLRSRWLTMGPKTEQFEAAMAEYLGVKHAIAVANCTCALQIAYSVIPAAGGDVLIPDITFAATANAAYAAGASPVLLDIRSPDEALISAGDVAGYIESHEPPRAVCTVHYAGFDADSEELVRLAEKQDLYVIEDAAHAVGSVTPSGKKLGSIGHIGCFSFFSNKNIATGEGGMLATNNDEFARCARLLRSHGMTSLTYERHQQRRHGYDIQLNGYNFRCTEISAALGLEQLKKLDAGNEKRRQLYRRYRDQLSSFGRVKVMTPSDDYVDRSACHIVALLCDTPDLRDRIRHALDSAGIQTSHHYRPLHQLTAFLGTPKGSALENAESFSDRQLTLPLHPKLPAEAVAEICDVVKKVVDGVAA